MALLGMDIAELEAAVTGAGLQKFRARQLWRWVWRHGLTSFDEMSDLGKPVREQFAAMFSLDRPAVTRRLQSTDGTIKWLLRFADGNEAETVYIPDNDRGTLCISSQVGCTLNCTFCHTGTQKLVRNLTAQEIVAQVLIARDELGEWPTSTENRRLTNIVFMGMGEPLYNLDNVAEAIDTISDGDGIAIGRRRITVSTAGVAPKIPELGERTGAMLAISLHAPNDALRDELVPINRKYPIAELLKACRSYAGNLGEKRTVTVEYTLLNGVNDQPEHAAQMVELLRDFPCKINLIPFNPFPGSGFERPTVTSVRAFQHRLASAGLSVTVRTTRGEDIDAACGQLVGSVADRTRRQARYRRLASAS